MNKIPISQMQYLKEYECKKHRQTQDERYEELEQRVEILESYHTPTPSPTPTPTPSVTPSCTITPTPSITPYITTTRPPSTTTQSPSTTPIPEDIDTILKKIQKMGDKIWNNEIGGNKTTDDYNYGYNTYNDKHKKNYNRLITYSAGELRIFERKGEGIISRLETEVKKELLKTYNKTTNKCCCIC